MQPITQRNQNLNKGPSSSKEFNELRNDIHYDIARLFAASNQNEEDILHNMTILIRENYFLQNKISELEANLENINNRIDQKLGINRFNKMHKRFTDMSNVIGTKEAIVDTVYGQAAIQSSSIPISKTSIIDSNGEIYIPKQLDISVHESFDENFNSYVTVDRNEDEKLDNVFDRNIATFWSREVEGGSEDTELYVNIHIKLPLNVISSALVNTIRLNPYPEYGLSIIDISYKGFGETWHRLTTYPINEDHTPKEIQNVTRTKLTFPSTEITELQIKLKQPYWLVEGGRRIFTYGLQELGVEYNQVDSSDAEIITRLSIAESGRKFASIGTPAAMPVLGCSQNIDDLVDFELYYDANLSDEFQFGYEIMADIDTIYIKTILSQKGGVVPVLEGFEIEYLAR